MSEVETEIVGHIHDLDEWQRNILIQHLVEVDIPSLTAAAPVTAPRAAFDRPEADVLTPMTYDEDGSVYGHLAPWGVCHRGFVGGAYSQCVQAPKSATNYEEFHLGYQMTQEGDRVAVGKITFDTDHAPLTADYRAAASHYDNTGSVGAYVRARDGRLGVWVSGVTAASLTPAGLQALRGNPLSGDWRSKNRNLELTAALAVPVPGFAVSQVQLALSASLDGEPEVSTLILPAYCGCEDDVVEPLEPRTPSFLRQRNVIAASFEGG